MIHKTTMQKTHSEIHSETIHYCIFDSLHSYTFMENCEAKVTKACRNKEQSTPRKNYTCNVAWQSEERLYRPKVSLYWWHQLRAVPSTTAPAAAPSQTSLFITQFQRQMQHTPPGMLCPYFNVSILLQMLMYVLKSAFHDTGASLSF